MTNKVLLTDLLDWMDDIADPHPMQKQKNRTNKEIVAFYLQFDRKIFKPPAIDHQQVLRIFNKITGNKSKLTKSRKSMMNGRAAEGNELAQFQAVFTFKYNEWKDDPEMKKYITLETMLRAKHFQNYLEQARADYLKRNPARKPQSAPIDDFKV